ncbi:MULTISPECIES: hypothetical protein [Vibrio]|nr:MULTISPECIES: hypothetical protein [Vibrio]
MMSQRAKILHCSTSGLTFGALSEVRSIIDGDKEERQRTHAPY